MANLTNNTNQIELLEHPKKLIQACIDGDRQSQNSLYEWFAKKMFGVCLRYSRNREEAEEIMQEGFVQVFKSLKSFKYTGSFEGWVRKIMVNCSIKHFRAKPKMYPVVEVDNIHSNVIANEETLARLDKKELLKMVQTLPPAYRMVFNLYVFEGMKHREIAEHLGIAEGTSKSNLFDAKVLLQKTIAKSLRIAINF